MGKKIKVKVFKLTPYYDSNEDDYYSKLGDSTDWEEIDEKFYNDLEHWARKKSSYNKYRYIVATPVDDVVPVVMAEIKKEVKRDQERERKKKEAAAKRKAIIARERKEKEKALLEKLKAKYGE